MRESVVVPPKEVDPLNSTGSRGAKGTLSVENTGGEGSLELAASNSGEGPSEGLWVVGVEMELQDTSNK